MKDTMLLFDLDGTLWDSAEGVAASWNTILQQEMPGIRILTADDIRSVMGKTMDEIADTLFPEMDTASRSLVFDKCLKYENEFLSENGGLLFPNVTATLEELKNEGYSMAIVSNCQSGYIPAFISSMGMDRFFCDYEEWGNTGMPKSDNIRLCMDRNNYIKGIYIGDTQKDKNASQEAGVPFIHAGYGFGTVSDADAVINDFSQLPDILKTIDKKGMKRI